MTTLVGTQKEFKDALIALLELEYDAIGAYELAIEKLESVKYKESLKEFLGDHQRHLLRLKGFYTVSDPDLQLPDSADILKGLLAKMKVTVGSATGSDINILRAMLDNERDTNTAYERMTAHSNQPSGIHQILEDAYQDEKKHKLWLENTIEAQTA